MNASDTAPKLSPYHARQAMAGARHRDSAAQRAFESGAAGEAREADQSELERAAYNTGRRQVARQTAGRIVRHSGENLARVGRTVTGTGGGWVGILVGVLAVIALYLLLERAGLANKVINGVTKGVMWLVAPETLPF